MKNTSYNVFGEDEDIPGGEVSMNEPFVLEVGHPISNLRRVVAERGDGETAPHSWFLEAF